MLTIGVRYIQNSFAAWIPTFSEAIGTSSWLPSAANPALTRFLLTVSTSQTFLSSFRYLFSVKLISTISTCVIYGYVMKSGCSSILATNFWAFSFTGWSEKLLLLS